MAKGDPPAHLRTKSETRRSVVEGSDYDSWRETLEESGTKPRPAPKTDAGGDNR